jgi:choline kinase
LTDIAVVTGYGVEHVEDQLARHYGKRAIRTVYNPFYNQADNLVSCWAASCEMDRDFILLNGDTLFEFGVLEWLLQSPPRPVTLTTDRKSAYDADDMKVILNGTQLCRVGKTLPLAEVNGESIGMSLFRGDGPRLFRDVIERALRKPEGLKQWYLSAVDSMAQAGQVWTKSIHGLRWAEVDDASDLRHAAALFTPASPEMDRSVAE